MSALDDTRDILSVAGLTAVIYGFGPATVVELAGEFDAYTARGLRDHLRGYPRDRFVQVVVDLRKVAFMDSSGIAVLVALGKQADGQNGALRLVLDEDHLLVKLQRMGLLKLWPVHADVVAASHPAPGYPGYPN